MQSLSKQNIVLFVLIILLGLSVTLYKLVDFTSSITSLSVEDIHKIQIRSTDKKLLKLEKQGDTWLITSNTPYKSADKKIIDQMLELARTESINKFSVERNELYKYQLDHPRISVLFNDVTIHFGDTDPIHNYRYLLIDDEIHLIKDDFYRLLLTTENKLVK